MTDPPLPFEASPLRAEQFVGNARPDCRRAAPQVLFHGRDRSTGGDEVEPSDWTGERVHVEVVFEVAAEYGSGSRPRSRHAAPKRQTRAGGIRTGVTTSVRSSIVDTPAVLSVGVKDEGEIIEEPDSVGRRLVLRVEDGNPVLGRQELLKDAKLGGRASHTSRMRPRV